MKGRASLRARLLLASCALIGIATVGEVALRVYHKASRGTPFFSLIPGYRATRFPLSPFLAFGPRIDWQIEGKQHPDQAYFNHQGFRHPGLVGPKAPGEFRIVTLGGSTTEDIWNDEGTHWPLILERELQAAGRDDVRVLNAAMSAYSSAHSLIRLQFDIVEYEPDLLLVMHAVNDLTVAYFAAREGRPIDPNYAVKYSLPTFTGDIGEADVIVSRLWHSLTVRLDAVRPRKEPAPLGAYDMGAGVRLFQRNLRHLVVLARANGIRVVLLTEPVCRSAALFERTSDHAQEGYLGPVPGHERFVTDLATYNAAVVEVGRQEGAPVIDMAALLAPEEAYFVDTVHYSTAGTRAFGAILASRLPATGALDPPGASGGGGPVPAASP